MTNEDSLRKVVFKRTMSPLLQDNSVGEDRLLMFPQVSVTLLPSSNVFTSVAEKHVNIIIGDIHVWIYYKIRPKAKNLSTIFQYIKIGLLKLFL